MKKYRIIYADPPWRYNDRKKIRKDGKMAKRGIGASNLYPVMTTEEIAALPVADISDENCALLLWATFPCLPGALEVIRAWGFRYVSLGFQWTKLNKDFLPFFGVGYYTKSNPEVCLFGLRGKMPPVSNSVSNTILAPHPRAQNGKIIHSQKPDIVREKIVDLFGDLPRIELFARKRVDGWDAWGNEVESDVSFLDYAK